MQVLCKEEYLVQKPWTRKTYELRANLEEVFKGALSSRLCAGYGTRPPVILPHKSCITSP